MCIYLLYICIYIYIYIYIWLVWNFINDINDEQSLPANRLRIFP